MAFSKARRLSDFISANGSIPAGKFTDSTITSAHIVDATIVPADMHATLNLTGKTVTVATASGSTNSTAVASTAFVQQELTTLIGGAPSTLNDLNELAAAINDDANYNSTLTTALATKLPLAGGTLTGSIIFDNNLQAIKIKDAAGTAGYVFYLDNADTLVIGNGTIVEKIRLDTSGHEGAITIDTDGKVGIGTASPAQNFVVAEGTNQHGIELVPGTISYIQAYDRATSDYGNLRIDAQKIGFGLDNGAEKVTFLANGRVGIGDSDPQDILEIRGVAGTRGGLTISNTNHNEPAVSFARNAAATARMFITEPGALHTSTLNFQTSNASGGPNLLTAMTIDQNQNVGIGTADIGGKLTVATNDGTTNDVVNSIMIRNQSTGTTTTGFGGEIRFQAERNNGVVQNTGRISSVAEVNSGSNISSGLGFWTGTAGTINERLRINFDGKIRIGNNIPIWSGAYGGGLFLKGNNATSDRYAQLCIVDSTGAVAQAGLKINNNGSATFGGAGNVTITDGDLQVANGHGIDFSATANGTGSMSSEILDDYEEGTWTPTIQGLGGNAATAVNTNYATYTKIGNMVNVSCYIHTINLAAITSGSYIVLTGLPFAADSYGDFCLGYKTGGWTDSATAISGGYVQKGQSYLYFVSPNGVEPSQGGSYALTKMMLNVTYRTT